MTNHALKYTLEDIAEMAAQGHSAFSPSSSKMWIGCAGSLIPNLLADDTPSVQAAEGTVAHMIAETWLTQGKKIAYTFVGTTQHCDGFEIEVTEEMLGYLQHYIDWVKEAAQEAVEYLTETRVDFSDLTPIPDQGGTADHIAIIEIGNTGRFEIVVTDLKYGKGIRVFAEGNTQALLYSYGSWKIYRNKYNITQVRIRIAHPRLVEGFTEHVVAIEEVIDFARNIVKPAAYAAWDFNAARTPSEEACLWCKVKQNCAAAYKFAAEVTSDVFDDDDDDLDYSYTVEDQIKISAELDDELSPPPFKPADPKLLTTRAMAKILRQKSFMEKFFNAIEAELLNRAISSEEEIPGWKVVEGRSNRRWPDNMAHVYKKLKALGLKDSALVTESFISPAQAEEKLIAKAGLKKADAAKRINAIAIKPQGQKSLARNSDTRKALVSDGDIFHDDD